MFLHHSTILLSLFIPVAVWGSTFQPLGVPFKSPVTIATGLAANVLFSNLTTPRGITFDDKHNLLVVERGFGVTAFSPTSTPSSGWERTVVIQNTGFTQGIQVDGDKLYVSSATDTFVYRYDATTKSVASNIPPFSIVTGIPGDGGMYTQQLPFICTLNSRSRSYNPHTPVGNRCLGKDNRFIDSKRSFDQYRYHGQRSHLGAVPDPEIHSSSHPPISFSSSAFAMGQRSDFGIWDTKSCRVRVPNFTNSFSRVEIVTSSRERRLHRRVGESHLCIRQR
jgi:hypothetical protein